MVLWQSAKMYQNCVGDGGTWWSADPCQIAHHQPSNLPTCLPIIIDNSNYGVYYSVFQGESDYRLYFSIGVLLLWQSGKKPSELSKFRSQLTDLFSWWAAPRWPKFPDWPADSVVRRPRGGLNSLIGHRLRATPLILSLSPIYNGGIWGDTGRECFFTVLGSIPDELDLGGPEYEGG